MNFDHVLLCTPCADRLDAGDPPPTFAVCGACLEFATSEVGDLVGVRGRPGVLERPEDFDKTLHTIATPRLASPLIDAAYAEAAQQWYGLCADGTIIAILPSWSDIETVARDTARREPAHKPFAGHELRHHLHVASSGRFAAVVNDYGRYGSIIDLGSGTITMELDGGEYHPETVPFSFTFAAFEGRDVVVHRTAWNRLDVSDPATGHLLTAREPTSYQRDEDRTQHYLDYFHGRLYLSPDGSRILDDGWVWHPVGIPEVWDLRRWLSENVWESEDGPSKLSLDGRDYYWDHGMCWIDSQRVAVEGIGTDDDHMVAGARIFDTTTPGASSTITWPTAKELSHFAGPTGEFFSNGIYLFSSADDGLSVWDVESGARIGRIEDFTPRHHTRATGEFVQLHADHVVTWRSR